MKKHYLLIPAIAFIISSCQNNGNKSQINELSSEVISVHDEIMPQIQIFDKTTLEIDSILNNLEEIKSLNSELDTTETRQELTNLKLDLEKATEDMMTWMRDYNSDSNDLQYYEKELIKINDLKDFYDSVNIKKDNVLHIFQ